jgi:hypothetical protein
LGSRCSLASPSGKKKSPKPTADEIERLKEMGRQRGYITLDQIKSVNTVAWHLQAQQYGGLAASVQRKMERLAAAMNRGEPLRPLTAIDRLRPGTTAKPDYNGGCTAYTSG